MARRALTRGRDAPPAGRAPDAMKRINPIYVAGALLGLSAAALSIWAAPGLPGFLGAGLALLMVAIAVIDARHFIIPNELNAAALALALINAAALAPGALAESLAEAVLRGAATFLLFFALRIAYRRLRGREGMGLGDVKLAFVAGVWLGWTLIPLAIEIAAGAAPAGVPNVARAGQAPARAGRAAAVRLVFRAGDLARLVHRRDNRRRVTAARFGDYKSAGPPFSPRNSRLDTQVLIVGAGPVGLTLAIDLGRRGIRCIADRAEGGAAVPAQDGAVQRPHHGNLPPAWGIARANPRRRSAARRADGRVHRYFAGRAAAAAPALPFGRAGAGRRSPRATTARCRSSPIS